MKANYFTILYWFCHTSHMHRGNQNWKRHVYPRAFFLGSLVLTTRAAAHQASLSFTVSGVYSNSHPLSRQCHPTFSLSAPPSPALNLSQHWDNFSNKSFFRIRWPKYWNFSSNSVSVLPVNIQVWFPLRMIDLISLQSRGLSRVLSNTIVQKHQFFGTQPSLWSNSHIRFLYNLLENPEVTNLHCDFVFIILSLSLFLK